MSGLTTTWKCHATSAASCADKVMKDGKVVGVSTSRGYSYYFREMLSLCTLDVACCAAGTEVTVVWGNPGSPQKEIRAKVAPAPYKTDNRKLDVHNLPPPKRDLAVSLSR